METLALFENGPARRIILGFLDPEDDPVKPLAINIDNLQMIHAANNGFYAAYQVLRDMGYITGTKYCFSYQLEEGGYAVGASAGLAFSLKFVQAVSYQWREPFPYNLAATGVISDGTKDAQVKRIEGMQPKLRAALLRLRRGDRLYYPAANEADIDDALRVVATDQGIELMPVTTLTDAIATLLLPSPPPELTRVPQLSWGATLRPDAVHGSEAELPHPPVRLSQPWSDHEDPAVGEAASSQEPYPSEQTVSRHPGAALSRYAPSLIEGMTTEVVDLDDEGVVSVDERHEQVVELRADDVAHLAPPVVRQRSASAAQSPSTIPLPSSNTFLLVGWGLAAAMVCGLLFVGSPWRLPQSTPPASDEQTAAPPSSSVPPATSQMTAPAFNSQGDAKDEQQSDRSVIENYTQANQRQPEDAKAYDNSSRARRAQDEQVDALKDAQKAADLSQQQEKTSNVQEALNQRTKLQKPAPNAPTPQSIPVAGRTPGMSTYAKKVGRFLQYKNGTALDTKTNLMWMTKDFRNIEGRAPNTWDEAMAWVEKMNRQRYGGYNNWRVPTTAEYQAIYDTQATKRSYTGSKIGYPAVFEDGGGVWLWSAELARVGAYAAVINIYSDPTMYGYDFRRGLVNSRKAHLEYAGDESIRLVRSGP
jgi:hypothetical protein